MRDNLARKRATYDDLKRVPDHQVAEILDGELTVSPRPSLQHALVSSSLVAILTPPYQHGRGGPGGWWIVHEPELHLGFEVMVPDIAGWRQERLRIPKGVGIKVAPDWVCEVLSPSTKNIDRRVKMALYAQEGVSYLWLADPAPKTFELYRLVNGSWLPVAQYQGDVVVRAEPLDAIDLDLAVIWDGPAEEGPPA